MNAPALLFKRVRVSVGAKRLLDGVDLFIAERGLVGIVGPNGCGKTSLLRTALGVLPCGSGCIRVGDKLLADWSARALALHVGYMSQQATSHWDLSVRELLHLQVPNLPTTLVPRCELAPLMDRRMASLSGGEKARVGVARALAHGPQLLLADEPAAHLDIPHHHRLMALLKETAGDCAVVVVLHDLHLAALYCDQVVLMSNGTVLAQGAPDEVLSPERLGHAYGDRIDVQTVGPLRFFTGRGTDEVGR